MGSGNWVDRDELWGKRLDGKWESFSWLTFRALLSSANDVIGRWAPRLVNDLRGQWVTRQRDADSNGRWNDDFVVGLEGATKFLLVGDPGEQDFSQYAVVPVLASQDDVHFMLVLSDVIYPSGDVNDYVDGFYIPYGDLRMPIYALPGNHDWYDGLNGFMWNFCGADPLPEAAYDEGSYSLRERVARHVWRGASAPKRDILDAYRNDRVDGRRWQPLQPGPYYAIETADVLIVCVDSGITGDIDRDQADWLVRMSESTTKPKLMLVGKPLVDKKEHKPGRFRIAAGVPAVGASDGTTFATVDDVARHRPYRYVAAIGGDTHNYQRYDVTLHEKDGSRRPFHYVVSGGAGAYMGATHIIDGGDQLHFDDDQTALEGVTQLDRFECYPEREESLRYFAGLVVPRLWRLVVRFALAILGVGVAAVAVLAVEVDGETLETVLVAAAAAFGASVLVAYFRPGQRSRATRPGRRRRGLTYVGSFLLGLILGLGGWWLSPEHFGKHLIFAGAVFVGVGLIAELLRKTGIWRIRWIGLTFLILQPIATLVALALVVLADADLVQVLVMAAAVLVLPIGLLLLIDAVRVRYPKRYKVLLAGLILVVALAALFLPEEWARAAAAAAVLALAGLLVAGFSHLHFLNSFSLFYRPSMRDGAVTIEAAGDVLTWRAQGDAARPSDPRTRRIGNMVHPGAKNPRGPLHRFISEIFDKDDPPLYKNFLRIDIADEELTITCFHATGTEAGPNDVETEEPISISLTGPGEA